MYDKENRMELPKIKIAPSDASLIMIKRAIPVLNSF